MRAFLFSLIFSFSLTHSAHAIEGFECQIDQKPGRYVPHVFSVTYDPKSREALVFDSTIDHFFGVPIAARVTAISSTRIRFSWRLRRSGGLETNIKWAYNAVVNPKNGEVRINVKPLHYEETFSGSGLCQSLSAKDARSLERKFHAMLGKDAEEQAAISRAPFPGGKSKLRYTCAVAERKRAPKWWPKSITIQTDARSGVTYEMEMLDGAGNISGKGSYDVNAKYNGGVYHSLLIEFGKELRTRFKNKVIREVSFSAVLYPGNTAPEFRVHVRRSGGDRYYDAAANCRGR
ncbi:hypothetical protein ACMU_16565 [Actibacterium mucosum KCTC 23349]|uniref:Uncharacterized protein n=1 Tax=Actibacterium mucosum KCTC 23349 TaxID=1454373 RepID=A0A037ZF15_9RHOB|nr:hypothetical protein [Actibacterium mucosum]KAJ54727.1 hypothetical protein ACMU_16565 [Actibacterium mucosum KCTC 23349]